MLAILLALATLPAPDDKPAKDERVTYRLLGLFSKDREKDLKLAFEDLPEFTLVSVDFENAEVTLAFAPGKLFPGQKPDRVAELVNDRVRGASGHTFGIKPRRTVPREKLERVEIAAGFLDCKACCLAAYEAVAALDGVEQATASAKEGRVTALIDPKRTDREKLEAVLKQKGATLGKK